MLSYIGYVLFKIIKVFGFDVVIIGCFCIKSVFCLVILGFRWLRRGGGVRGRVLYCFMILGLFYFMIK